MDVWSWPLCKNQQRWSELFQEHRQCPMFTRDDSGVCAACRRESRDNRVGGGYDANGSPVE